MGGLSCATSGLSSRLGDVSRELVLEPPGEPSTPECAPPDNSAAAEARSSEGMMSERPDADADLITDRERSLIGGEGVGMGGVAASLGVVGRDEVAVAPSLFASRLVGTDTAVLPVAVLESLLLVLPEPLMPGSGPCRSLLVRVDRSATGDSSLGSAIAVGVVEVAMVVVMGGRGSGKGAEKRCCLGRPRVVSSSTERAKRGMSAMPGRLRR